MGIVQHHDAVSGTETQNVTDDYVLRLSDGVDASLVSDQNIRINSFDLIITCSNKFIIILIVFRES